MRSDFCLHYADVLTSKKERNSKSEPDYDWAIRTFYFSSKKLFLRAAYEMMLVQRNTGLYREDFSGIAGADAFDRTLLY